MPFLKSTYCQCAGCDEVDPCGTPPSGCICGATGAASGGNEGYDNTFDISASSGISYDVTVSWTFYTIKDQIQIYLNGSLLYDSGCVNGSGSYGFTVPTSSTSIRIVINGACEGGTTAWDFDITCENPAP